MSNLIYSLTDAFALACSALEKGQIESELYRAPADDTLYNVWVTDKCTVRTLVRENVSADLSRAIVSAANNGAKIQGSSHTYEAVPVGDTY